MEIEQLDHVSRSLGQTLTSQEFSSLEIGFLKRKCSENLKNIRFWGKLMGEQGDYIIAVAILPSNKIPKKKFYFLTNSSPDLQQFPEVNQEKRNKIANINGRLIGDPSILLEEIDPANTENTSDTLQEIDRLVCLVEEIDLMIATVPSNAYIVTPNQEILENPSFYGLLWDKAIQMDQYFHFREPQMIDRKLVFETDGLIRPNDFLDPLSIDLKGSWSLERDNTKECIILRNFIYPGSFFFHIPETRKYGYCYFGDGIKNKDIAFML